MLARVRDICAVLRETEFENFGSRCKMEIPFWYLNETHSKNDRFVLKRMWNVPINYFIFPFAYLYFHSISIFFANFLVKRLEFIFKLIILWKYVSNIFIPLFPINRRILKTWYTDIKIQYTNHNNCKQNGNQTLPCTKK